ncbi:MAG TPA: hypothetical protein VE218_05250, partial [Acidobacteriaceae bacterium]|nr:hypothetical protein [Acidobacteriaceae bacterium]
MAIQTCGNSANAWCRKRDTIGEKGLVKLHIQRSVRLMFYFLTAEPVWNMPCTQSIHCTVERHLFGMCPKVLSLTLGSYS